MLKKQEIPIPLTGGLVTGIAKELIPPGQFLELENTIFLKEGLVQKRNGFEEVSKTDSFPVVTTATPTTPYKILGTNFGLLAMSPEGIFKYHSTADSWRQIDNFYLPTVVGEQYGNVFCSVDVHNINLNANPGREFPNYYESTNRTRALTTDTSFTHLLDVPGYSDVITPQPAPTFNKTCQVGDYVHSIYQTFLGYNRVQATSILSGSPNTEVATSLVYNSTHSVDIVPVSSTLSLIAGFNGTKLGLRWFDGSTEVDAGNATTVVGGTHYEFVGLGVDLINKRIEVAYGDSATGLYSTHFTYTTLGVAGTCVESKHRTKATSGTFAPISALVHLTGTGSEIILRNSLSAQPYHISYQYGDTSSIAESKGNIFDAYRFITKITTINGQNYAIIARTPSATSIIYYCLIRWEAAAMLTNIDIFGSNTRVLAQWGFGESSNAFDTSTSYDYASALVLEPPYTNLFASSNTLLKCVLRKDIYAVDSGGSYSVYSKGSAIFSINIQTTDIKAVEWASQKYVISSNNTALKLTNSEASPLGFLEPVRSISLTGSTSGGSLTAGNYVVTAIRKIVTETGDTIVSGSGPLETVNIASGSTGSIAVVVNGGSSAGFDIQNLFVKTEIYCSEVNQSTPYFVSDSSLTITSAPNPSSRLLYSEGGLLEASVLNPFGLATKYRNNIVGVSDYTNKLVFSAPITDGEVPRVIRESEIQASSSGKPILIETIDEKLIVFSDSSVDYFVGEPIDDLGNATISGPNNIILHEGLVSFAACQKLEDEILFKGKKGFMMLSRGLTIDDSVGMFVKDYDQYTVISSTFNPSQQNAYFGLSNGVILCYSKEFQKWSVITTSITNFLPGDMTIFDNCLYVLDTYNNKIWKQNNTFYDLTTATPVLHKMTTGWLSVAGVGGYARTYWIELIGEKKSSGTVTVEIAYDFETSYSQTVTFDLSTLTSSALRLKIKPQRQKCSAFKLRIKDSATSGNEGITLSALSLEVGIKSSQDKPESGRHMG